MDDVQGLSTLLGNLRELSDLPRLVDTLGHLALYRELPPDHWGPDAGAEAAAVIGRAGDFWWHGALAGATEATATTILRRLRRAGEAAGVWVLDPVHRALTCGVAFGGAPVRTIGLDAPATLDLARLTRMRGAASTTLGMAARVADALSSEDLGDRFYRRFRMGLDRLRDALPGGMPDGIRHELALLHLTRVLFLYFVQAKGWLDGRGRFLAEELDRCLSGRRSVQRTLLAPLWFGTLNRSSDRRSGAARRFGAIPFLNGGLFEPQAIERRWPATLPNDCWRVVFDDVFEPFHFTPRHGDGRDTIEPTMLGRVFESVMDPAQRKSSGSFYTPPALVRALLDEGLGAVLASRLHLGAAVAARRVEDPDPAARAILDRVTILDPAVGTGAFLVAALDRLAGLPLRAGTSLVRRHHVLRHCLFGVDRDARAVRLAELRLWLELLATDDSPTVEDVAPLPNLDSLVRQGDSLVDPMGTPVLRWVRAGDARTVARTRARLLGAHGGAKGPATRELRRAEAAALHGAIGRAQAALADRIGDLLALRRGQTLFGERPRLDRDQRAELDRLLGERRTLRSIDRALTQSGTVPWFHYPVQFADVFLRGGFDLVIGNPPWVRAEHLPDTLRLHLAERYRWWKPSRGQTPGRGYGHQPDLAIAFLERSAMLAGDGGTIAMLVPGKLASAGYAAVARESLCRSTTIRLAADLSGDPRAVFEASVYPYALVATTRPPPPDHRVRGSFAPDGPHALQRTMGAAPWVFVPDTVAHARQGMKSDHPTLAEYCTCHLGVKTGLNRVFLDPPPEVETQVVVPAVRGRDVEPFRCRIRHRLLWPYDRSGRVLEALPPRALAYLRPHVTALKRRRDWQDGPWWSLFRTGPVRAPHLVIWPDLADRLKAAVLDRTADGLRIPLNSCYVIATRTPAEARRIAAWLNAPTLGVLARLEATPALSGYRRFNAGVVGTLPCPPGVLQSTALDAFGHGMSGADREALDETVGVLLGLSPPERKALRAVDR